MEDHTPVIQCNIRDVTARVQMQRTLSEQAVALTDLHRRKDEFLAMISHELRNPLAPIANAVQLLALQPNENAFQRYARTIIERQVGKVRLLLDDLLEVSRMTTGRIRLHQERVAVGIIVQRAVESVGSLINEHRHTLDVTVPLHPLWVHGDARRLEQVIVNLLTNSAKYSDDGGHISLVIEQDGNEVALRVEDTGIGIAPELLPHVFDIFTQAEQPLARSSGGLGIGLSVVRGVVQLHGGRVDARSELGRGSEFVVHLPLVASSVTPPETTTLDPPVELPVELPNHEPSLRILVVDDNMDASETMALLLQAMHFDVRIAHTGPTALVSAEEYRPDVVLLDIGLPEMDGFEVARSLRRQATFMHTVLIALTGYGQHTDVERSMAAGFDHHMVKPADFVRLRGILDAVHIRKRLNVGLYRPIRYSS